MAKPQIQTRVDQHVKDDIERIRQQEGIQTRSAAVRYLLAEGIRAKDERTPAPHDGWVFGIATQLAAALAAAAFVVAVLAGFRVLPLEYGVAMGTTLLAPSMLIVFGVSRGFFREIDRSLKDRARRQRLRPSDDERADA